MTFEEDLEYFNSIDSELAKQHKAKFVLVKDKQQHGIFSNFQDAHEAALKKFGITEVVIAQIGVSAPLNYLASVVN